MDQDPAAHRIAELIRQCDQLAAEVFAWRRRYERQVEIHAQLQGSYDALSKETHQLAAQVTHARATIANMERSRFWQLRLVTVRIRRLFGSSSPPPAAPLTSPAGGSPPDASRP